MFMITSYPLIYKTINDLNLNIEYFIQGNIKLQNHITIVQ